MLRRQTRVALATQIMVTRIELLGGLRISSGQRVSHRLQTRKAGALLAYLAYFADRPHPRSVLGELLWPDADPDMARHNLRQALFSIRRQFEEPSPHTLPLILADREAVQINPERVTTDVSAFRLALRRARQASHTLEQHRHLQEAVELYRGELLPGLNEDWILPERRGLADKFVAAVRQLAASAEETGALEAALDPLRRAASVDSRGEEIHFELLRVLQRSGRAAEGLDQFQSFECRLREYGAAPSARLRELREMLLRDLRTGRSPAHTALPEKEEPVARTPLRGTLTLLMLQTQADAPDHLLPGWQGLLHELGGAEVMAAGAVLCMGFERATTASEAALECQRRYTGTSSHDRPFRSVLHTAEFRGPDDPEGAAAFAEAAALLDCSHWGQILCSGATAALLQQEARFDLSLRSLGNYKLRREGGALHVYQVENAKLPSIPFPPLAAEAVGQDTLPRAADRFFGRERELQELAGLLSTPGPSLVTLTGPGGSGKTRLAVEVARELGPVFGGGIWFVPLVDLVHPHAIPNAILASLGLLTRPNADPLQQVIEFFRRQRSLVVLDNLEHLIGAQEPSQVTATRIIETLFTACPSLMCLATSRQRLGLSHEREYRVEPLPVPNPDESAGEALLRIPSVQLFSDRATAVRPDFRVTARNALAVAQLCQELEGLPLAIELAASRAAVLTPTQMVEELQRRFRFLATHWRSTPERHRSAWATVDWSYRLLAPDLQRFFTTLSVFRGGWLLDAAAAVSNEEHTLEFLESLQSASLIQTVETSGSGMRFRMLETLREFGWEVLSDDQRHQIRQRHADFYLQLAREADAQRLSEHQSEVSERIAAEFQNLQAALSMYLEHESELALELATRLSWFWEARGHVSTSLNWLERALERATRATEEARARALSAIARLRFWQRDFSAAKTVLEQARTTAKDLDDSTILAEILARLGMVGAYTAEYPLARTYLESALHLYESAGDHAGQAQALLQLGIVGSASSDWGLSNRSLFACVECARRGRELRSLGLAYFFLGDAALSKDDLDAAEQPLLESLAVGEANKDEIVLSHSIWGLALLFVERRELSLARQYLRRLMTYARALGGWTHPFVLECFGYLAAAQADFQRAASLLGAADSVRQRATMPRTSSYMPRHLRYLNLIRDALTPKEFEVAWREGEETAPEVSIERAAAWYG